MPLPPYAVPVILAGGALAALYVLMHDASGSGGTSKGAAPTSADFPEELKAPYQKLITSPTADPAAMDVVAAKLAGYDFKAEAQALGVRSAQLRRQKAGGGTKPTPTPSPATPDPGSSTPFGPDPLLNFPRPADLPPPVEMSSPAAPAGPQAASSAVVTTHDPPPSGDLSVFASPGGPKIGGADKGGTVTVLRWNVQGTDGQTYAEVAWAGSARNMPVHGYAHQAYLAPQGGVIAGVGRAIPREIIGRSIQREIIGRAKQREIIGRAIAREIIGRSIQREIVGAGTSNYGGEVSAHRHAAIAELARERGLRVAGNAGLDILGGHSTESHYQRKHKTIGRAIPREIVGRAKQREIVGRAIPREIIGRMIAREIIGAAMGAPSGSAAPMSGGSARVAAPSGFRLRSQPTPYGKVLAIAPRGALVRVLEVVRGPKRESVSPGQGGQARVAWNGVVGWAPLEWLTGAGA